MKRILYFTPLILFMVLPWLLGPMGPLAFAISLAALLLFYYILDNPYKKYLYLLASLFALMPLLEHLQILLGDKWIIPRIGLAILIVLTYTFRYLSKTDRKKKIAILKYLIVAAGCFLYAHSAYFLIESPPITLMVAYFLGMAFWGFRLLEHKKISLVTAMLIGIAVFCITLFQTVYTRLQYDYQQERNSYESGF